MSGRAGTGEGAHEPGAVLVGKYRVDRVLGRGGMGVVVEAHHLALDQRVALKFLLPHLAILPDATERFLREARAVIRIKGEHVARVMDVGTLENGEPFMVMEFLEGQDLLRVLKQSGPMPIPEAVDCIIQACDAITEAHGLGIIHRDIKLANLFRIVGPDGSAIVKVLDFGISKVSGSKGIDRLTRTAMTMGSAHYMSPEQMHSMRDVDHRADIYSLGVSLFTLLAGQHPYPGDSLPAVYSAILTGTALDLRRFRADVPEPLARAIARTYEREPEKRYPSVAELVFALSPFAPPHTRPTIDRIARMTGRAAPPTGPNRTVLLPEAVHPAVLVPATVTEAATLVLPARRAPSKAPLVLAMTGAAFALLIGGGLAWMHFHGPAVQAEAAPESPAAADPTSVAETPTAEAEPAPEPSATAPVPDAPSAEPSGAPAVTASATSPPTPNRWPRPPKPPVSAHPAPTAAPAASRPSAFDMR